MITAQKVAERELLIPPLGPKAEPEGGLGGCSLLAPLRKLTTMGSLPIDWPPCGERNAAMAAT